MNNLYKSFKLVALLAAVIGLAACQKGESDVMELNGKIAKKNLIKNIVTCANNIENQMEYINMNLNSTK